MIGRTTRLDRQYDQLSADERARLTISASARGDETELTHLSQFGEWKSLSYRDHAPTVLAFTELSMLIQMELLRSAGQFQMGLIHVMDQGRSRKSRQLTARSLVKAEAWIYREQYRGWSLFCEQLGLPADAVGKSLPGWDDLIGMHQQSAIWAYRTEPEFAEWAERHQIQPITAARYHKDLQTMYQRLCDRWSGEESRGCPKS